MTLKHRSPSFFGESISQSFTTAAYTAYKKYGALLIGVNRNDKIMLNPGVSFKIEPTDTLYYICSSSEDSAIIIHSNEKRVKGTEGFRAAFLAGIAPIDLDQMGAGVEGKHRDVEEGNVGIGVDRISGFESASDRRSAFKNKVGVDEAKIAGRSNDEETYEWMASCLTGFPPLSPYLGYTNPTMCYITENPVTQDDMRLSRENQHYAWAHNPIVVLCREMTSSLFNLIVPLRSHTRSPSRINPIIIVTSIEPDPNVLDGLSSFPLIYYCQGDMSNVDDLLWAGIVHAQAVLVFADNNRESHLAQIAGECSEEDEHLADRAQVIDCLQLERMFPEMRLVMELTHISNLRFLQFKYWDHISCQNDFGSSGNVSLTQSTLNVAANGEYNSPRHTSGPMRDKVRSKVEHFAVKKEVRHANMPYLFREAFATGKAFSTSMLDTLLYQSFIKPYLPDLLKLMLGLHYCQGSGHLSTYVIKEADHGKKFSSLFYQIGGCQEKNLGLIPFGLYRKIVPDSFIDEKDKTTNEKEVHESRSIHTPGPPGIFGKKAKVTGAFKKRASDLEKKRVSPINNLQPGAPDNIKQKLSTSSNSAPVPPLHTANMMPPISNISTQSSNNLKMPPSRSNLSKKFSTTSTAMKPTFKINHNHAYDASNEDHTRQTQQINQCLTEETKKTERQKLDEYIALRMDKLHGQKTRHMSDKENTETKNRRHGVMGGNSGPSKCASPMSSSPCSPTVKPTKNDVIDPGYVILNPDQDLQVLKGDIIYVIKPPEYVTRDFGGANSPRSYSTEDVSRDSSNF